MKIKAVIFDFGNTLVDYPLRDVRSQLAFVEDFMSEYTRAKDNGLFFQGDWATFAQRLNTERGDYRTWSFLDRITSSKFFGKTCSMTQAIALESAICNAVFNVSVRYDESKEFVHFIKRKNLATGVVSNLPWGTASSLWRSEFSKHGFGDKVIDQTICCMDVGYRKPHPAPLLECISKLKCAPAEVIYIGDAMSDMKAAKAAGCSFIWLNRDGESVDGYSGLQIRNLLDAARLIRSTQANTKKKASLLAGSRYSHLNKPPTVSFTSKLVDWAKFRVSRQK